MRYKIAIASGKGGTGKTSVALHIFNLLQNRKANVELFDFDVEEPNDLIFFPNAKKIKETIVNQKIPVFIEQECTFCGKCVEFCEFNAISLIPSVKYISVDTSLCHSCGACTHACNYDAVSETKMQIGTITSYSNGNNSITEGRLKIGSAMQTMVIKELKKYIDTNSTAKIQIFDSPPGTSCSVVETIINTHYVVLVAEPTPFGLHDLKLMVKLIKKLELSYGVVINKAGLGNNDIYEFIKAEQIEMLGEIPFSTELSKLYSAGDMFNNIPIEILNAYENITKVLIAKFQALC